MSDAEKVEFSLKVMMNKEKTKVLFAEVDSDLADVLLSFLTLPLGTIVRLLEKHYGDEAPVFGSLTSLYKSLAGLDDVHFWTEGGKLMLLNPRSSFQDQCQKLELNIDDTQPTKYFACEDRCCLYRSSFFSMYYGAARCKCGKAMNRELDVRESKAQAADVDEVFILKTVSFLISDDLRMVPIVARSIVQTLNNLGITDTYGAEQRTVTFGFDEIMDLLRGSLFSVTPLTELILHKRQKNSGSAKFETGSTLHQIDQKETSRAEEKMILNIMVQKSTNRFLFAQAEEAFVDFLFSFLTIPLAGVESLLGSNSCLKNIDNLHRSSANLNKYLKNTKNNAFNPNLLPMYLSKNQIFSLNQQGTPQLYYSHAFNQECFSTNRIYTDSKPLDIIDPKGRGSYVTGPRVYMVTDDLTVTPLCMSSSLSILNRMKIQLSDVHGLDIDIGLEEALSILKASLTSTCAITNGLSSILNKQPKQEY